MNALNFALKHPITIMVAMVAIVLGSLFAVNRMRTDVYPDLNMPVIYVAQAYGGMDSAQMEGLITNYYEYAFLYMNGIDHVESKNIQNLALVKLYFHPGTDMAQAMAEAGIYANRVKAYFPPGTLPPFIMRLDASSVPVAFLVLSSETRSISELSDLMLFRVRPTLASIPGASSPQPFGGSMRTIVVNLDPQQLRSYKLSPQDVADALNKGNTITPSGNAILKDQMPIVSINSLVLDPQDLGNIPLVPGRPLYLRDVGKVEDSSDIPTGWALVNGRRSIYMPVVKTADASTLAVANALKANQERMQAVLPEDVKVSLEFDQSPYVTGAVGGVVEESAIGAILTGLMVLLFLRDWRSVVVVVLTIPLALMGAVLGLWIAGQTINLMTLGGLSLAVGILVDEATVVIENIHTQMGKRASIARAVFVGTAETLVPILLAMLCILAVFMPSFMMEGAARGLFIPLAIGVGFAMIFAFVLSITFVPVLSIWMLRHSHADHSGRVQPAHAPVHWFFQHILHFRSRIANTFDFVLHRPLRSLIRLLPGGQHGLADRFTFERVKGRYSVTLRWLLCYRWWLIPIYGVVAALVLWLIGGQVGREIAPHVDSGQFQLRMRAPAGTRLAVSELLTRQVLEIIKNTVGPENVDISVSYVGVTAPTLTVNAIYLWTGGTDQAVMRIALRHDSGVRVDEVEERLRRELPRQLEPWLQQRLAELGYDSDEAAARAGQLRFSFEPADVVNQVMTFGSPTPVEVLISGPDLAANRAYADKVRDQMEQIPSLRDLQFGQVMDYPRVMVDVDRERAGLAGVTMAQASTAMVAATASSRYVVPVFWADPKSGIGYQVQLQVPQARVYSVDEVGMIPIKKIDGGEVLMRDVARIKMGTMPEEYDRLNQLRYVSLTANIEGEDLGRVSDHIDAALKAAGEPPRGVKVEVRGQVPAMLQMFHGLGVGLGLAVVVVFLLLTAYFQSVRLALVATATAPAVVSGVAVVLYFTGTTLNIESFMGAIMAIGVAVANAILLVTFAERNRVARATAFEKEVRQSTAQGGVEDPQLFQSAARSSAALEAAILGARERLRPILMTSCAMIAGMLPMALGLGEGGEQSAPLGRAVIGGLGAATFATLFVLPSLFAVALRKSGSRSASLDYEDPESRYYKKPLVAVAQVGHNANGHRESIQTRV